MNNALTETTIATVSQSMQLMRRYRKDLGLAMERYIAACASGGVRDGSKALAIMDMLFDHALGISGVPRPAGQIEDTGRRHRMLEINAQHYAYFGDGLGAIMKDVLAEEASPALLAAWGDTYWNIVRSVSHPPQSTTV